MLLTLALVAVARGILPPDEPEVLRALGGLLWRAEVRIRRQRAGALRDQAGQLGASARAAEGFVREALDLDLQRRLEELILARVEPEWLERYVQVEELPNVSGCLLVGLSRPHPLMAVVALSAAVPGLACVSPRGARGNSWAEKRLSQRFDDERARLRTRWIAANGNSTPASPDPLATELERGNAVFVTDDSTPLSCMFDTRPVFVHRARDKRWRVAVGDAGPLAQTRANLAAHAASWPGQHLGLAG